MDYFITNLVISALLLAVVKWLNQAPARLHLMLLLLALLCWFIPWHNIELSIGDITNVLPNVQLWSFGNVPGSVGSLSTSQLDAALNISQTSGWQRMLAALHQIYLSLPFTTFFLCLSLAGFALFGCDVWRYRQYLTRLKQNAMPGDELLAQADLESTLVFSRQVKVKITLASQPGMATGLFSPVIWLNQHFSQSKHVNNILLHELTHLRQFDPLLKWLAAFSKRVFWWNPVVKWIVDTLELVIEVNCDQICYQKNREKYRTSLAEIIWQQNRAQQLHNTAGIVGIATIHHANSVNIKRLKALEVEKKMKLSYLLVAGMSLLMTTLACAHLNSRGLAPVTERLHTKAIHFKNQRAKQPPMPVFLPKTEVNSEYNRQILQLIELSRSALSADVDELDQLFHLINTWDANRAALGAPESKNDYFATNNSLEQRMVMQVVSILHFLLQQQDKSSEIVALLGRYFPEPERMPQFYRHHLARAYLRLADARKATEIMQLFDYSSEKIRPNTISMMVRALVEDGQYEKALEIVEQRLAMTPTNTQLQYLKYGVLIEASDYAGAEQVSRLLQQRDKKVFNPLTRELSMIWSPVLDHI